MTNFMPIIIGRPRKAVILWRSIEEGSWVSLNDSHDVQFSGEVQTWITDIHTNKTLTVGLLGCIKINWQPGSLPEILYSGTSE